MNFNYRQLTFAREYRGYSQTYLAKKIEGLSQSNLSKYEKGFDTLSEELLLKIIDFLSFPVGFFKKKIFNDVENAHYRKKATITKSNKVQLEYGNKLIGYIIDQMAESIEWPEYKLSSIDLEDGFTPEQLAIYIRRILNLEPDEPIVNVNYLLEKSGIIVVEIDSFEKFDGVSFISDRGQPVIVINRIMSNDRKRFTLSHELGHLIMHSSLVPKFRDKETEANDFASEFLMPSRYIKNSLYGLKIKHLGELKKYWLTSMASILMRAKKLKCIDNIRYKYLNIELSRSGQRKKESISVFIDEPKLFERGYNMHRQELEYTDSELSEAFNLPLDVIIKYFGDNNDKSKSRLKVIV